MTRLDDASTMHGTLVVGVLLAAALRATAAAAPVLPAPLQKVLERVGVPPVAVESMVLGTVSDETRARLGSDPATTELMERARGEDVTIASADGLFDTGNVQLGFWDSEAFLCHFGTALFVDGTYRDHRTPVFLVHGINGSPRDFATLMRRFRGSSYQPVAFFYPTGMALDEAARQLGERLQEFLRRHPTTGFAIVGHSAEGVRQQRRPPHRRRNDG